MQPFSKIVRSGGAGASAVRKIMMLADRKNIINLGLDPAEVISFGGGWVGHQSPEGLRAAYRAIASDAKAFYRSGAYSATSGMSDLKRIIADLEQSFYGLRLTEEQIIIGQSATQLTHAMFLTLLDPDDHMILFDPTYASFTGQAHLVQRSEKGIVRVRAFDPKTWTYRAEKDILADLRTALSKYKPKLILFSSPDNPTGYSFSDTFIRDMIVAAEKSGTYVAMDLTYHALYFGDKSPAHVAYSPAKYKNLVRIHSTSKWCRGLGRRLGWIEADAAVIGAIAAVQQGLILSPDMMHQMAFAAYLKKSMADGTLVKYLETTRLKYKRAADVTMAAIDKHVGARYLAPTGSLYVVMDVGRASEAFSHELLKRTGVVVIPGDGFGTSLKNGVRISFGPLVDDLKKIETGIKKMGDFMHPVRSLRGVPSSASNTLSNRASSR